MSFGNFFTGTTGESCPALVEDFDGNIKLILFHENDVLPAGRRPGSSDFGAGGEGKGRGGGTSSWRSRFMPHWNAPPDVKVSGGLSHFGYVVVRRDFAW
jgi:hypothetical protein